MKRKLKKRGKKGAPKLDEELVDWPDEEDEPEGALTRRFIRRFCAHLRKGRRPSTVVDYMGISWGTFHRWIQNGEAWLEGDKEDGTSKAYAFFVIAVRKSLAAHLFELQEEAADFSRSPYGDPRWKQAIALLERLDRANYGKKELAGMNEEEREPDERFL